MIKDFFCRKDNVKLRNLKTKKQLESKIYKLKQQRNFLLPRVDKSIFGKEKIIKTLPIDRMLKVEKLEEEILMLENKLRELSI